MTRGQPDGGPIGSSMLWIGGSNGVLHKRVSEQHKTTAGQSDRGRAILALPGAGFAVRPAQHYSIRAFMASRPCAPGIRAGLHVGIA
jgi:hypothetical protein